MSEQGIAVQYKGEDIRYQEWDGKWSAAGGDIQAEQLKDVKAKLDALAKAGFKRREAYRIGGYNRDAGIVTVTSDAGSLDYDKHPEFWCTEDGKRRKYSSVVLFAADQHNREVIGKLAALEQQTAELRKAQEALLKTLHPFVA